MKEKRKLRPFYLNVAIASTSRSGEYNVIKPMQEERRGDVINPREKKKINEISCRRPATLREKKAWRS